jgi:CheY-like chemotaxis protein
MIIAGVVFLAVMDGLMLFNRYAQRKTAEIADNMRLYEGYSRLRHLAATSDSVSAGEAAITLWRRGEGFAELAESDSLLIARAGAMTDTLMPGVSGLRVCESSVRTDTDSICLSVAIPPDGKLDISLPVRLPVEQRAMEIIREQEKQYTYEE